MADSAKPKNFRSKYCCVPHCENSFYQKSGMKSGLSFFAFPLDEKRKKRWLLAIKRQEKKDGFFVTEHTKVSFFDQTCEPFLTEIKIIMKIHKQISYAFQ